jgi:hypothetical protein
MFRESTWMFPESTCKVCLGYYFFAVGLESRRMALSLILPSAIAANAITKEHFFPLCCCYFPMQTLSPVYLKGRVAVA